MPLHALHPLQLIVRRALADETSISNQEHVDQPTPLADTSVRPDIIGRKRGKKSSRTLYVTDCPLPRKNTHTQLLQMSVVMDGK